MGDTDVKEPQAAQEPKLGEDGLPEIFSEDDLSPLSEAEIEAIKELQAEDAAAADDHADTQQEADAPETQPAPVEVDPAPAAEVKAEPELPPVPDVSEAKTALEGISDQVDVLKEQFKDGDLDEDEYADQLAEVAAQRAEMEVKIKAADAIKAQHDQRKQAADDAWYAKANAFMDQHPAIKSDDHIGGFDQALKFVTGSFPAMSEEAQLEKAYHMYAQTAQEAGTPVPGYEPPKPADPSNGPKPKLEAKKGGPEIPPTIASIPATDMSGGNDGKFSTLDRVVDGDDPYAAEDFAARLSEADMDSWLAGA